VREYFNKDYIEEIYRLHMMFCCWSR